MAERRGCSPHHSEVVTDGEDEFRVFRCDWGWCVKVGDDAFRSSTLIDAFEQAYQGRLSQPLLKSVVRAMEHAMDAEHARTGTTARLDLAADSLQPLPPLSSTESARA